MRKDHEPLSPFFNEDVIKKAIKGRVGKGRLPSLNPPGKFHRSRIYMGESYSNEAGGANALAQGLVLWLKADAITGLADTDPVASWVDSSGNNNTATQGTAGARPVFRTGMVNGLPVVRFDGVDDFLESPYSASDNPDTTNQSIFAVFRPTTTATSQIMIWQGEATANGFGTEFEMHTNIGDGLLAPNFVGAIVGGQNAEQGSAIPFTDTVNFHVLTAIFTGLRSVPRISAFLDGGSGITTVSSGGPEIINWTGNTRLGRPGAATRFFSGDFAEVLIYNIDKSAQRAQIEAYLKGKYGL